MTSTPAASTTEVDPAKDVFSTPVGQQKSSYAEKQRLKKMAAEIQAAVQQRGAVKGKLTRIRNALQRAEEEKVVPDVHLLRTHLKTIDAAYEEFNGFQNQLYALSPATAAEQEAKYIEFEDLYNEVRATVCRLLEGIARAAANQAVANQEVVPVQVPVQQIQTVRASPLLNTPMPTFDGKAENWFKFKAIFTDVMNKYPGESEATKLYHLDKCLVGDAAGAIDQQTINDSNFDAAWEYLTERYEDVRKIVDLHANGLLNLKAMTAESGKQLRTLVDECKRHVEALKFHEYEESGLSDVLLVNILASKIDLETRKLWEGSIAHGEVPTYEETIAFLMKRCQILERIESNTSAAKQKKPVATTSAKVPPMKVSSLAASAELRCNFCEEPHNNHQCSEFLKLSPNDRFEKAKHAKVCYNCLRKGHTTARCTSAISCKICKKRHHTTLHLNVATSTGAVNSQMSTPVQNVPDTSASNATSNVNTNIGSTPTISASCVINQQRALLCTAIVNVVSDEGVVQPCRILLDCGSQANLLTEKLASLLQVKRHPVNVDIIGVDGASTRVTAAVNVTVQAISSDFTSKIECLVMKRIAGTIPSSFIDISTWPMPSGLQLADAAFNRPQRVDMLIGVGHFFGLLKAGKIKLAENLPFLQETVFGWVVGGLANPTSWSYKVVRCNVAAQEENLEKLVAKFWESEEVSSSTRMSPEEVACEEYYKQTTTRDSEGRYVVKLPFRTNINQLGVSKQHAEQRFGYLERKFGKDEDLKKAYCDFMADYIRLGHCRVLDDAEDTSDGYFLPHHAILKPTSSTTKLRTVFDASAKSSSGLSLNDTLMVGPTIQDPLVHICLRFRIHPIVFTGDISKMYRMISVSPDQSKFQRVFWRTDPLAPLSILELTTVTYGTASAPYLATRTLQQLAQDEGHAYPRAAKILVTDFYIDDVLSGAETLEEAVAVREELVALLRKGGFELHKWCTNSPELLASIPEHLREKQVSFEQHGVNNVIRTLGVVWDPTNDQLRFHIASPDHTQQVTKRFMLSEIAKIYDPMGLLSPVVVVAKLLMRRLWRSKISWDEEVPEALLKDWRRFRAGLEALKDLKIERLVVTPRRVAVELHAFSDASLEAFGTCVYLRSILEDNTVEVKLLVSKSRVAPKSTIPRLELCGFLLMARLVSQVESALQMNFARKVMWSDSQIVLCWMRKAPHLLSIYVGNRVSEVQELTSSYNYRFVRSEDNPADLVSRGLEAEELVKSQVWWNGPDYLRQNVYEEEEVNEIEDLPEVRVTVLTTGDEMPILTKYSSFRKLQRVMSYVIRFISKARKRRTAGDNSRYATVTETRLALTAIIRMVQQQQLYADIHQIKKLQNSDQDEWYVGRLRSLNPWIDDTGILRVNGRIKYANVAYEQKHPPILPAEHSVTKLLIQAIHNENLHVGPSGTLSIMRQRFWIINGRNAIRQQLRKCVRCFKASPGDTKTYMGNLPSYRVTQSDLFQRVGIDYAGPIYVRKGHPRKPVYEKGYIALFVCMATKCIHIEFVSNLTTSAFIGALHRFVSRRGLPTDIFSDNATNFAGASSELHELYVLLRQQHTLEALEEFKMPREINWHFIPPRSPHVGGLWEAGVKSAKYFLKRTAGEAKLTEEEWNTLLVQVEGLLNSRPLIALSADPSDYNVITAGHLLIGRAITAVPEPSYDQLKSGILTRWQHIQKMRSDFWKRWSVDYLAELQQRQKWNKHHTDVKVGDLVLLREENIPPSQWKLGRVVDVHPGKDDITRVVSVRTPTGGVFKRSTAKVAVLPLDDPEESSVSY